MTKVAFFTVTCHSDYDFLLGAIEHHAGMGTHLVLDTSPPDKAVTFSKLPDSVVWVHEPFYGYGWKEFRYRTVLERALRKARLLDADILVSLDSDEFYIEESAQLLFPRAADAVIEVGNVHWKKDGKPYTFGHSEWHCRIWPRRADVQIAVNTAWQAHPLYNGNPEHHPVPIAPRDLQVIRVYGNFRHHLHYALGQKADDEETAINTIDGWPDKGTEVAPVPWPKKLKLWKDSGELPSESFR
jgi:hypothetical protein